LRARDQRYASPGEQPSGSLVDPLPRLESTARAGEAQDVAQIVAFQCQIQLHLDNGDLSGSASRADRANHRGHGTSVLGPDEFATPGMARRYL